MAIFVQRPRTTPDEVLGLARPYFQTLGLCITHQDAHELALRDGHGYVRIEALPLRSNRRRVGLTVDSCGWEAWARHFLNHTD